MEQKVVKRRREFVQYKGRRYWLQSSGRYFQSGAKTDSERLLHRRIWIDNFGPIPDGMEVHHKDEDWRNNALDNLELKSKTEHLSHHALERWKDPEMAAVMRAGLAKAIQAARGWHSTAEGREWHRQNGIKAWSAREWGHATCTVCQQKFETPFPSRSIYCTKRCENKAAQARHQESRACVQCGAMFSVFKFVQQDCCSRTCGVRRRHGHTPTIGQPPTLTNAESRQKYKCMEATCAECGALFLYEKHAKTVPQSCSHKCRGALLRAKNQAANQRRD